MDRVNVNRVAVPVWVAQDDMADMIVHELRLLGKEPVSYRYYEPVPENIDVLMTFGPYDKVLPMWQNVAVRPKGQRPVVAHWNTEGMPDIRIPYRVMKSLGLIRSWLGRMSQANTRLTRVLSAVSSGHWKGYRFSRYRYTGDYEYGYRKGWLHVLADSSLIYCRIRSQGGLPTLYAPWGGSTILYDQMNLERDIDVLWIGKRGSARRSHILDQVVRQLKPHGVRIHIADNVENPFIFNGERTEYLNRSKVTLNITRTWYDDNFSRFVLAAPNRSLIVSEPVLEHCREFKPGLHYVAAKIPELAKTILYYLQNDQERHQIVENAYRLVTRDLLFANSLKSILAEVEKARSRMQLS